ncbi:hypothetical protein K2X30_00415 [bacterium]|nr:hypothetical protein [bacterium]
MHLNLKFVIAGLASLSLSLPVFAADGDRGGSPGGDNSIGSATPGTGFYRCSANGGCAWNQVDPPTPYGYVDQNESTFLEQENQNLTESSLQNAGYSPEEISEILAGKDQYLAQPAGKKDDSKLPVAWQYWRASLMGLQKR